MYAILSHARTKTFAILLASLLLFGALGVSVASAQTTAPLEVAGTGIEYGAYTGLSGTDIRITIANIIRIALGLLGTIALLLILYAGFLWMTAAGDDTRIASAKKTMSGAVIGLVIIVSAFGIVSFIMSSLIDSTSSGGGGGAGGGGGGGGGFGGGGATGFRPTAIQPSGPVGKRDVVVSITFSTQPTGDVTNLRANILLEKVEGTTRTPVEFTPTVTNNVVRLVPDAPCPAPNDDRRCLDADADFVVTIRSGLMNASTSNPLTVRCGIGDVCSQTFSTGDGIGTEPPTVAITNPTDGQSVPIGELIQIQTLLGDEYGIGSVDYFANGTFIASDGSVTDLGGGAYSSQTFWDTAGTSAGFSVALGARATNIDGDSTDAVSVRVVPRPAHCFNLITDFDETGPDCGGADCGSCTGGSCTENSDCASGQCVEGQCVVTPKILDVQARDGAPGNIITITGSGFGSGTGTVTFLGDVSDDTDDVAADLAQCSGSWGGERVFVVVPAGAASGPIRVTTSSGKTDATNDTFGPVIPDFTINDIARPGICRIEPTSAKAGQILTLSGEGFGDTQGASRVEFAQAGSDCIQSQSFADGSSAGIVDPWSSSAVEPTLPNLSSGSNGQNYLVRVSVGGQPSNTACMRVLPPSAGSVPRIDFITPTSGSVGTYLTVFGGNFGAFGTVRFSNSAGTAIGDVDFPAQCGVDFWNEGSVTVKVPDRFTAPAGEAVALGAYQVAVVRNDGQESNAVPFSIDSSDARPGICRIEPNNGPPGTAVTLHGEGFGAVPFGDLEGFAAEHPDAVLFTDFQPIETLSLWNDGSIGTVAPEGTQTGPVTVRKFSGASFTESNPVNFEVRDCRQTGGDLSCGAGRACCGDGACRADCGVSSNTGGFSWQFSTGPIPVFPVVLEDATCRIAASPEDETVTPSPNPFRNESGVCTDIASITLRFSLPMDPGTFNSSSVILERCGTGSAPETCEPVPVGTAGTPTLTQIEFNTQSKMNLPVSGMEASTWYRLTVTEGVTSMSEAGRIAQPLDGNFDGRLGGSYVTRFKTGETPCILSGVNVDPARGLIETSDGALTYVSEPLSARCIVLGCQGRTVDWTSSDTSKATVGPSGAERCTATALPVSETDPGPDIDVRAVIEGFTDAGKLKVDYANPRVVEYGPNNCTVACVNTLPYAVFNTPMAVSGSGNVTEHARLLECANESCLAYEGEVVASVLYDDASKMLMIEHGGLAANTFYRVVIDGDAESTSAAPLTGLNFEDSAFSWIFRTRADGNPCGPQAISVSPSRTTLRFIGARSEVQAIPKTSPDACSETGQLLTANSFNWSWTKAQSIASPEIFTLLPDHPTVLSRYVGPFEGCSSSCLATGSFPPNTSECGNGILERGESCETPGVGGCTDRCLLTGNVATNGCGDGIVDASRGEACDEGDRNGEPGSGCTTSCRFTGSVQGLSVCGNGSKGIGEECDDGNTSSGDGCSSACLLEGSDRNVPVCGNGVLETYFEQCDYVVSGGIVTSFLYAGGTIGSAELAAAGITSPNAPDFPCSTSCLFRGNTVRGDAVGACGNGVIDRLEGENCDAGPRNGVLGSGCSSSCLKTGSDIVLGAFCGDGEVRVEAADLSGAENGGGEDCDPNEGDAIISPKQVVEAFNRCDAGNSCTATVSAAIGTITGTGNVSVECACRADSDCTVFGAGLACGSGACCHQRPAPPDIDPKGFNECRNAAITVSFPVEMNVGSLTGNIVIEHCGAKPVVRTEGNFLVRAFRAIGNFFKSLVGLDASAQAECTALTGTFEHASISNPDGTIRTQSRFSPDAIMESDAEYRVSVATGPGGVESVDRVGYPASDTIVQSFGTGSEICGFDILQVEPASLLIQSSDDVHGFVARSMTNRGGLLEEIAPIAGVYDWAWEWATVPIGGGESVLSLIPEDPDGPSASVQANRGINGREQLIAKATVTADAFFDPSTVGEERVGKADITTFLCENPWPRRDPATGAWSPYVDPETHFETYYCRDTASGALLPELTETPVFGQSGFRSDLLGFCTATFDGPGQLKSCGSNADCSAGDTCRKKDAFFRFRPEWRLADAIGLRVAPNIDHLSPQRWYEAQLFTGRTEAVEIDGYHGIKDDRTMYVSAADKYGDPQLRSYIYVFGFNDGADDRTIGIFDQLIGNLSFNTNVVGPDDVTNVCRDGDDSLLSDPSGGFYACSTDLECLASVPGAAADVHCDADKDKLTRDMLRWEDLHTMTEELDAIRTDTGFYPRLESGSFIRGMTTSAWPSWSALGGAAVRDPLNAFNRCEDFGSTCSITRTACVTDADCDQSTVGDVCRPKFESSTCFNSRDGIFMCPQGSRVYRYQAIGGIDYRLQAEFEYTSYPWGGSCEDQTSVFACETKIGCYFDLSTASCRNRISITPSCYGVFAGNTCLVSGGACADDRDCNPGLPGDTCQPTGVKLFGSSVPGSETCGNGLVEATEECEIGDEEILACAAGGFQRRACLTDCSGFVTVQACPGAPICGNSVIEQGETCDDGAQNGQYGQCRVGSLGCTRYCVNIAKRSTFTAADIDASFVCLSNASCGPNEVCTDRMNFCGDGVKNGPEACDDGVLNGGYGKCAWDCSGPGPRCGDFNIDGSEQCDGNQVVSSGVCIPRTVPPSPLPSDGSTVTGTHTACSSNADCASGETCALCAPTVPAPPNDPGGLPQTRTKGCQPPSAGANACTFANWSACKPSGACGNGVVEGNEQCDAGSSNSLTGACLPTCRLNVCNDGFVHQGVEQCDQGSLNGTRCNPKYGLTCNYCKNDCTIETISGAFCGDGGIQKPPGGSESCDAGPVPGWCSRTYTVLGDNSGVKGCLNKLDCEPGVCRYYQKVIPPSGLAVGESRTRFVDAGKSPLFRLAEFAFARNFLKMSADIVADAIGYSVPSTRSLGRIAQLPPGGFNPTGGTKPTLSDFTVSPTTVAEGETVQVDLIANDPDGVETIRISYNLQSGGPDNPIRTCTFSPPQTTASCPAMFPAPSPPGDYLVYVNVVDAAGDGENEGFIRELTVLPGSGEPPPSGCTPSSCGAAEKCCPGNICVSDVVACPSEAPEAPACPLGTYCPLDRAAVPADDGTVPCWAATDCASSSPDFQMYCDGGEGQCVAYNGACVPEPYSNTTASEGSVYYLNGACNNCSNSCLGSERKSPLFCGDGLVQYGLGEECDGSGDPKATGNGSTYLCRNDCTFSPTGGFCGDGIIQTAHGETCDEVGKGCISDVIPNPDLYLNVDMVFAIDISGSMVTYIDRIRNGIAAFANEYRDTDHRFAVVTFGQASGTTLETDGHVVTPLTGNIDTFIAGLDVARSRVSGTRAIEPMYQSAYELMSDGGGAYGGIDWSSDAQPYLIVVTDTYAPDGHNSTDDSNWVNASELSSRAINCSIGSCAGSGRVETFVITTNVHYDDFWTGFTFNEKSERFIDILASDYRSELRSKTFANVCSTNAGTGTSGDFAL